jgi:hypothetical protein
MSHSVSPDDRRVCEDFEACRIEPGAFDHRAHIATTEDAGLHDHVDALFDAFLVMTRKRDSMRSQPSEFANGDLWMFQIGISFGVSLPVRRGAK